MTLSFLLQAARVYWWLMTLGALLGVVGGSFFLLTQKPSYSAETSLVVASRYGSSSSELFQGASYSQLAAQNLVELVGTPTVLEAAAKSAGMADPDRLAGSVTATVPDGKSIIQIRVTGPSAQQAIDIANGAVSGLRNTLNAVQPSQNSPVANVVLSDIDPARDASYLSPSPLMVLISAFAVGALVGYSLSVLLLSRSPRLSRSPEVEDETGLPLGRAGRVDVLHVTRPGALDPDGWRLVTLRILAIGAKVGGPLTIAVVHGMGVNPAAPARKFELALRRLGPPFGLHLPIDGGEDDAQGSTPGDRPDLAPRVDTPPTSERRARYGGQSDRPSAAEPLLASYRRGASGHPQRVGNLFLSYSDSAHADLAVQLREEAPSLVVFLGKADKTLVSEARAVVELCALVGVDRVCVVVS